MKGSENVKVEKPEEILTVDKYLPLPLLSPLLSSLFSTQLDILTAFHPLYKCLS